MPIVKQQSVQPLIRDAVVLDLGDLGKQAARLRAAAEARAQQILDDARAEAQRIVDGAEQKGFEKGHAEGSAKGLEDGRVQGHAEALTAGAEQVKQVTAGFTAVAEEWEARRAQLDREARTAVLDFAIKFAGKVTHRTVEIDPQVVVDQVGRALSRVLEPTDVAIRVHPEDRAVLQEVLPDLLAGLSHLQHVDLHDDERVGRGGCVLGLHGGAIDASIDTQMRRLAEVMLPAAGDEPSSPQPGHAGAETPATDPSEADSETPQPPEAPPAPDPPAA